MNKLMKVFTNWKAISNYKSALYGIGERILEQREGKQLEYYGRSWMHIFAKRKNAEEAYKTIKQKERTTCLRSTWEIWCDEFQKENFVSVNSQLADNLYEKKLT
jgi:hypothetical protein